MKGQTEKRYSNFKNFPLNLRIFAAYTGAKNIFLM